MKKKETKKLVKNKTYATIVAKALIEFDNMNDKYEDMFENTTIVNKKNKSNIERNEIYVYKDDRLIMKGKYEVLGCLDTLHKIWIWGWAIPHILKKENNVIRTLLNYGLDLENDYYEKPDPNTFMDYRLNLKTQLITSRFRITNSEQIDIYLALAMYLTKQKCIYTYQHSDNLLIFYFIIEPQAVKN